MPDAAGNGTAYEVVCPHCRKPFRAELMQGAASRYEGFKCPHCRLFFPSERVDTGEQSTQPE